MERESSKECSVSFLWTNESFSLWNCLSKNSTLFSTRRIGALGLFWTNNWGTIRTLWSKKRTFLKGNFCIHKGFMDVFYLLTSAWKKNHKMCIWNWFSWTQPFNLCHTNYFFGLTYGFLNKHFQEKCPVSPRYRSCMTGVKIIDFRPFSPQ